MSGINDMNNTVIACVDGSSSTRAVCEYAAWLQESLTFLLPCCMCWKKRTTGCF
jgi:hypothetical protein